MAQELGMQVSMGEIPPEVEMSIPLRSLSITCEEHLVASLLYAGDSVGYQLFEQLFAVGSEYEVFANGFRDLLARFGEIRDVQFVNATISDFQKWRIEATSDINLDSLCRLASV